MKGKILGTIALLAVAVFVSTSELKMLKIRKTVVRFFAVVGLGANLIWIVICILGVWNSELVYGCVEVPYHPDCPSLIQTSSEPCVMIDLVSSTRCGFLALGQVGIIAILVSAISWVGAALMKLWVINHKKSQLVMGIVAIIFLMIGAAAYELDVATIWITKPEAVGITELIGLMIGLVGIVLTLVTLIIGWIRTSKCKKSLR